MIMGDTYFKQGNRLALVDVLRGCCSFKESIHEILMNREWTNIVWFYMVIFFYILLYSIFLLTSTCKG